VRAILTIRMRAMLSVCTNAMVAEWRRPPAIEVAISRKVISLFLVRELAK